MEKRDNWFVNYQSIDNKSGQRDLNYRKSFFNKEDFENKSVLDIGCNMGQMCKYAHELGANYVLGMDYDMNVIKLANSLLKPTEINKINYLCDDIDNYFCYTNLQKFDTILLLSVIETIELKNRFGILSRLHSLTDVLYFEGHINSVYSNLLKMILDYTLFTRIEFKGIQYDNNNFQLKNQGRHVFRCSNEKLSNENACKKIIELLETKDKHVITIVGNGGVGKTTFKHQLIDFINTNSKKFNFDENKTNFKLRNKFVISDNNKICDKSNSLCIIDDVVMSQSQLSDFNYIIYIDYRALEYLDNVNTIFYMNYKLENRYNNRERCIYHRSPTIKDSLLNNIENIYNIKSY